MSAPDRLQIVVWYGCFAYDTMTTLHHSSFCYYYKAGFSNPRALTKCFAGQYAD